MGGEHERHQEEWDQAKINRRGRCSEAMRL